MTAAAPSSPSFKVPEYSGIRKLYGKVQGAVETYFDRITEAGREAREGVDVWKEAVRFLVPRTPLLVPRKAHGKVTHRRVRPGRLMAQLIALVDYAIKGIIPVFWHSQVTLAHEALGLGLWGPEEPNPGEPKPIKRLASGAAGENKLQRYVDPPGVRHTREILRLADQLGLFKAFKRSSEEGHELRNEGRTTVRVLDVPQWVLDALKRVWAARKERQAARSNRLASAAAAAAPAARSAPAAAGAPVPSTRPRRATEPSAADEAAVLELLEAHRTAHAARYRASVKAYTDEMAGTISPPHWPAIARELTSLASRGQERAAGRCRDFTLEEIRSELIGRIVKAYFAQDKPRVVEALHPVGWLWAVDESKVRELRVLGAKALDEWSESLDAGELRVPARPVPEPEPEPEPAGLEDPIVVALDESDPEVREAREAGAELRAHHARMVLGAELGGQDLDGQDLEPEPDTPAPALTPELEALVAKGKLTVEQARQLVDLDGAPAGGAALKKPP